MLETLQGIQNFLWGGPILALLLGVGIYQTVQCKFIQFTHFKQAITLVFKPSKSDKGDINSFQSLMTALAGAIGTGNITGIATALAVGGVGSLFWMWIVAFFGMATAYSETLLAIKYRKTNRHGSMSGGPMYSLIHGLGAKKLAFIYALLAGISALGIGCMVQANSVVDALTMSIDAPRFEVGAVLAVITFLSIIGGVKVIGKIAGILVPLMALLYLFAGFVTLFTHLEQIPSALYLIFSSAFTGQAAVGGFVGSTLAQAMQNGAQYGIFANEAGLGSLAIAGASAKTSHCAEQGLRSVGGVFIATMVVCTITGLVLAVTGVVGMTDATGNIIKGSPLAILAFSKVNPSFGLIVLYGLIFFAYTTILAWCYYGEKCFEYIFGEKSILTYRFLFVICVLVGAVLELDLVWAIANVASALMALPNLISIILLSNDVISETKEYLEITEHDKINQSRMRAIS